MSPRVDPGSKVLIRYDIVFFFSVDSTICPSSNHNRHFDREKMDSREKPARAFHVYAILVRQALGVALLNSWGVGGPKCL